MTQYQTIYLAPHLDDAALSCGGRIYTQTSRGEAVLVVTIMAGEPAGVEFSPFAQYQHEMWRLSPVDAVAQRRLEDIEACRILGAAHAHWDILDCIYRRHPQSGEALYASEEAIFGALHTAEVGAIEALAERLRLSLPPHEELVVPLALGNHIDHQFVRRAAELAFADSGIALRYYEDYPYIQREPDSLAAVLAATPAVVWYSQVVPLAPVAIQARIEATLAYKSQLNMLFGGEKAMKTAVIDQIMFSEGECFWHFANSA